MVETVVENIHKYIYEKYFAKIIQDLYTKYSDILGLDQVKLPSGKKTALKKGDLMRMNIIDGKLKNIKLDVFEMVVLDFCKDLLHAKHKLNPNYAFYLYTLIHIIKNNIYNVNRHVIFFVKHVISQTEDTLNMDDVLHKAHEFIEKNTHLLKYADIELFDHQKQIFTIFKQYPIQSKLVLYTAPTGTGKTLTPVGLSNGHRIIFICAARHIGLALAKSAISVEKKIGIAFGCDTPDDIRLHYFAASEYSRNKRSGGIGKVDNSVGDKVEIMICDVKSYIIAMNYMLAFSEYDSENGGKADDDIITYWDEPTIGMDYDTHPLHEQIQYNWKNNKISKMVLSCATLPHETEIQEVLHNYRGKFEDAVIHAINSYDCRKSVALLNNRGKSVVPHLLYSDYDQLHICVRHCELNKSLLRYFDLVEIVRFIQLVHTQLDYIPSEYRMEQYFEEGISAISMNSMKMYYLKLLKMVAMEHWETIHSELADTQSGKFTNMSRRRNRTSQPDEHRGFRLTCDDAHTLTDGPSIYLVEDVEKMAKFYVEQTNIPDHCLKYIMKNIEHNNVIQKKITSIENTIESKLNKNDGAKNDKKLNRTAENSDIRKLQQKLDEYRGEMELLTMDIHYIPNTQQHQQIWVGDNAVPNAFMPRISDNIVIEIMTLDVSNDQKLLLLLGIGMFLREDTANPRYLEVMKRLAYDQCLFLIIASSDYIYGTNYQFCHGFISDDLTNMTQQKTIQALGRIGRNQTQQEYTVRFRQDDTLKQLFHPPHDNKEARIMNQLFN
jgi:hypothetical protein